jgi:tryptophanyl-tRNA synthetase
LGLIDALVEHLNPIRIKYEKYLQNPQYLREVLEAGGKRANAEAQETLSHVRRLVGLV